MVAPQGFLRARCCGETILFQVEGRAQMDLGLVLRRVGDTGLGRGAVALLVDLHQCEYMDSTFLGTLLFLKRAVERRRGGGFALVAPSLECRQLLETMGLTEVFPICPLEDLPAGDWKALGSEIDNYEAFHSNVVQAHFELASLPGRAGEPFKKIARILAQEMEATDGKASDAGRPCAQPPKP